MLNDLQLFNDLVEFLLAEEKNQPVAQPIPADELNAIVNNLKLPILNLQNLNELGYE